MPAGCFKERLPAVPGVERRREGFQGRRSRPDGRMMRLYGEPVIGQWVRWRPAERMKQPS